MSWLAGLLKKQHPLQRSAEYKKWRKDQEALVGRIFKAVGEEPKRMAKVMCAMRAMPETTNIGLVFADENSIDLAFAATRQTYALARSTDDSAFIQEARNLLIQGYKFKATITKEPITEEKIDHLISQTDADIERMMTDTIELKKAHELCLDTNDRIEKLMQERAHKIPGSTKNNFIS